MAVLPHQIIFLNGPRHSGKDTAANFIYAAFPLSRLRKFSTPLKASVAAMFNIDPRLVREFEEVGSSAKLVPRKELLGMSWVEALIWLSEDVLKPKFGKQFFGHIMLQQLAGAQPGHLSVITDSGFADEAFPVIKAFGASNCHLFQLHRLGCTFDGDSRDYWTIANNKTHIVSNEHDLQMFRIQILKRVCKIMGVEKDLG